MVVDVSDGGGASQGPAVASQGSAVVAEPVEADGKGEGGRGQGGSGGCSGNGVSGVSIGAGDAAVGVSDCGDGGAWGRCSSDVGRSVRRDRRAGGRGGGGEGEGENGGRIRGDGVVEAAAAAAGAFDSALASPRKESDGERLGMGGEVSGAAANGREASGGGSRGREAAGGGEPGESVATLERAGQGPDPQKARKEEEHEKDEARGGKGREGGALASSPAPLPSEGGVFVDPMRHLPLVCRHGGLHPASVARLKLVSRAVYLGLLAEEGMPPPDRHLAASNYYCAVCVGDHIRRK